MADGENSEDSDDWFDKDENEILEELHAATKKRDSLHNGTEIIAMGLDEIEEIKKHNFSWGPQVTSAPTLTTAKLRKIAGMTPLDAFLYALTLQPDIFERQIRYDDSLERVILYAHILAEFCKLEFPGFSTDLARCFIANTELLVHFQINAVRLFSKRFSALWTDIDRVDEIVRDLQILFLHADSKDLFSAKSIEVMQYIKDKIVKSDNPGIAKRKTSQELLSHLEEILNKDHTQQTQSLNVEIYPTLDELQNMDGVNQPKNNVLLDRASILNRLYKNIAEYIKTQQQLLREDFLIPLREYVRSIKQTETLRSPMSQGSLYDDVYIVLNEKFLNVQRHEMVFVDFLGSKRQRSSVISPILLTELQKFKTGTLLCFTTSFQFDNLVLATISYTDQEILHSGYLSIEVARQFNIGNIFDKKLIMFEAPAFFEPYKNVYTFLDDCNGIDFPMKEYIVFGETKSKSPNYLSEGTTYGYQGSFFKPLNEAAPKGLTLNSSQLEAYSNALKQCFCLIQGPPGAGKTYLSVHLMRTLIENAPKPIVLITYTNESLDKFLLKLSEHSNSIVRFGSHTRLPEIAKFNIRAIMDQQAVNPNLKRLYYLTKLKFKEEFLKLQTLYKEFDGSDDNYQRILIVQANVNAIASRLQCLRVIFQYYIVREKAVVAMTTTCAAKMNFLFRLLKSSVVMFEEAAEILESHVIACLTPYTQHVIMIGDHMQLQPYTSSYQHSRSYEMNVSLFETMIRKKVTHTTLNVQYRMRPIIADLICPIIYEHLHNNSVVETYSHVRAMGKDLFFVAHEESETQCEGDISFFNSYEAVEIAKLALHLIAKANYTTEDVVILSPYARQIKLIRTKLVEGLEQVRTVTVDSFQGLEANIVLLSLVRSNRNEQIGFLRETNRICVALSRAKMGMYVIGNMGLLAKCCGTWRAISDKLDQNQAIGPQFPYKLASE